MGRVPSVVYSAVVLAWLGVGATWGNEAAASLYNEAGELYRAGQYEQAIVNYEKILEGGLENGWVYYNLGNAYFKAGRLGRAIWAYERARKCLPRDEDIQANLKFVNLLKTDKDPPSETGGIAGIFLKPYEGLSVNDLTLTATVLYILLVGLGIARVLGKPLPASLIRTALRVCGVLCVLVIAMLGFKIHTTTFVQEAIVMPREVTAHSGPGENQTTIFVIHEGTKVTLERQSADWVLIRLKSGPGGWIRTEAAERI